VKAKEGEMVLYILGAILICLLIGASFIAGLYIQSLKDRNKELEQEVSETKEPEESAVVDITPQAIFNRAHDSGYKEPEDSAVLHIKTRKELSQAQDRELDKLVGQYK
jgi:hypothetical protein